MDRTSSAPSDLERLTLQMANVERALLTLKRALNDAVQERRGLVEELAELSLGSNGRGTGDGMTSDQLTDIAQKLDQILGAIDDR